MIRLQDLCKSYDGTTRVVDAMSFEVPAGATLALLGPSGCGKTTTLRLIAGLDYPDSGRIFVDGVDVTRRPAWERGVAMVFQHLALWPHLNVRANLEFGPRLRAGQIGLRRWLQKLSAAGRVRQSTFQTELADRIDSVATMLHIEHLLHRMPDEISGGERQRVALARALVRNPKVLLLDEPFSNLDTTLRGELRDELRRIQSAVGVTTILVTHDPADAAALANQVLQITHGRITG